jgi:hypothetical protein
MDLTGSSARSRSVDLTNLSVVALGMRLPVVALKPASCASAFFAVGGASVVAHPDSSAKVSADTPINVFFIAISLNIGINLKPVNKYFTRINSLHAED